MNEKEKKDVVNNDISESKTNWRSMYMITGFCFFDGLQYSMFIVSLWPYLNTIDPTAGATFFGIITAGFSLGQAIGSPVLGFWMNRVKSSKSTIIIL
uniref:Major facilitator superfamily (MFS) profile domain-containing protein n=1 Tax=Acrobeloides nanus TaxID=290746 RepID=A0A914DVT4_9BILA